MDGASLKQRQTILNIFEEKGKITEEELSKILGKEIGMWDMRPTLMESTYKASLMGQSLPEFTEVVKEYDRNRLTQYMLFVVTPQLLNYQIGNYNPSPSNASLDPNINLDRIELDGQSGLKTYDYVPITPESLDSVKGANKGTSESGTSTQPKTGADRASKYSSSWSDGSVKEAVENIAPDSSPQVTDTGKIIYSNPDTNQEVVYDIDGNYYRIIDNNITGKRNALDINGNPVPNNIILENGKQLGLSQSQYNSMTHFNNTDMDFPYDR